MSSPAEAEEKTRHISDLVDGIPLDLLAQSASHCGAHARALQYYESFVRSKEGGGLNPSARRNASYTDEEVTFLQVWRLHCLGPPSWLWSPAVFERAGGGGMCNMGEGPQHVPKPEGTVCASDYVVLVVIHLLLHPPS